MTSRPPRWIGPMIVTITGLIMLTWSWGTWPDCVLDFGRELYVPWRLSQGEVLYRDIVSYFNGPLSPYTHALLFKIFGASLRTLVLLNLIVIAALVTMLYRLIARAFGSLAATICCSAFFILFAFAQCVLAGNYNFLCPYSYELPHGITLSVGAILCFDNWRLNRKRAWLMGSGALLGLVFLTKAEVSLAAGAALGIGLLLAKRTLREIATFLAAMILPVALAVISLRFAGLKFSEALRGIAGAWRFVGDEKLLSMPYFKTLSGMDNIGESVRIISIWSIGYLILFGVPIVIGLKLRRLHRSIPIAIFITLALTGLWFWRSINWNNFIRPAPVLLLIVAIALFRKRKESCLALMLVIWSLAMLAKMGLNAHIDHYGFALAMPATIITLAILLGMIPRAIERAGGNGNLLRAVVLAATVCACHSYLDAMGILWSRKTILVGDGADAFRADWRAATINEAIDSIEAFALADATLVVVPEGLIVNYLTRRVNPTGQLNFTPPAIVMYGESEMLAALKAHPPDFILFTGVDTKEYGPRFFGGDYAQSLGAWIQANYRVVHTIGKGPFRENGFGAVLLQANTASARQ